MMMAMNNTAMNNIKIILKIIFNIWTLEEGSHHSHLQEGVQTDVQQLQRNKSVKRGREMVW